jgi:membrane protein
VADNHTIPPQRATDGPPRNPLELGRTGWAGVLARVRVKLVRDRVSMAAGSLAFHGFFALFPAVIALLGLVTLLHLGTGDVHRVVRGIDKALPAGAASVFTAAVEAAAKRSKGSSFAVVAGIVVALWSAGGGMAALQQALDMAYEVPVDRSFLSRRLVGLPLMLATLVLGGTGATLVIFGASIGSALESHSPVHGPAYVAVWTALRWVATVLAISALFSFFYYAGPNRSRPRWQWVSAGGLVSTGVFLLASLGFSFYATEFGSYGRTYGSFAGVAVLIFWLYLTGFAVLLGGELNAEVEREAAAQRGHPGAIASARAVLASASRPVRPLVAERRRPPPGPGEEEDGGPATGGGGEDEPALTDSTPPQEPGTGPGPGV